MNIKGCSIDKDYSSYEELKKRSVVAQGWSSSGDVSFLSEDKRFKDFIDFIESDEKEKEKCIVAFKTLFDIKSGDIVVAFEGAEIKGICQIPDSFAYLHQSDYQYSNAIFPVKWVDWNDIANSSVHKGFRPPNPMFNIQKPTLVNFIKENWPTFRDKTRLQIQPDDCNEQLKVIQYQFPEKVKESKERYYLMLKNKEAMKKIQDYVDLLNVNKNLVLTGAPGTGKTFLAKKLAMVMLFEKDNETLLSEVEKKQFEEQCAFVQFHPSYDYTDFVEGLRPKKETGQKEISFELKNGIFMEFCKKAMKDSDNKYVFIIDEINRAEISKVFGELFFSIDPGYRGEAGKVKTQYANLREEKVQYFYVPKNVYIIGTMNDIDRSVESFDFAMRRRFVWKEITSEQSAINMKVEEQARLRMESLNKAIEKIEGLNPSYHIGAAYFLKLKNYNNDYEELWRLHLEPLVREYLRGLPEADNELKKLKATFI
jgi:hypothetical protein